MKFRDSIPDINKFMDLPGIAKQVSKMTDALCGKTGMNIVSFTVARGDLYYGTDPAQGSRSIPERALSNGVRSIRALSEKVKVSRHFFMCLYTGARFNTR